MAANQRPIDYYDVLGVPPTASTEEIRAAYRWRIAAYHPDSQPSTDALVVAAKIDEAFEILGDPDRRRLHDAEWGIGKGEAQHRKQTTTRERSTDAVPPCPQCGAARPWFQSRSDDDRGVLRCWRCGLAYAEGAKANKMRSLRFWVVAVSPVVLCLDWMFLDSKFLEQVDGLGWGSVALFAVVSGLAAVCTLVVALVAGIGRLRRRLNVQLARLHASLPKSTVTFPIDFKGVGPIADWRRLVYVFVFPIQLVAGFPFFVWAVWHYGIAEAPSSDGYWLFGVPIAPGSGILILSGLPPTPRLVLTNTLLTILWKICWWLETLICVIGVVTLGYVVWSAVASVSLTSIGILIVVLLIVIIHRLSQIHPKITSEDGKASAPAAPGSPESSGGAPAIASHDHQARQESPSAVVAPVPRPASLPVPVTAQVRIDALITLERLGYSKTQAVEMLPTPLGLAIQKSLQKG